MKTLLLGALFFCMSVVSAVAMWNAEYELEGDMTISRTPKKITIQSNGLNMELPKYAFGKGSCLGASVAKEGGFLSLDLPEKDFRKEVAKLGTVLSASVSHKASVSSGSSKAQAAA